MNKNISILFAVMTILIVAALFEGDGTVPAIAEAARTERATTSVQDNEISDTAQIDPENQPTAPLVLTPGQQPAAPVSEPDPPFVQPEPLK